jgi:hypothetical protein
LRCKQSDLTEHSTRRNGLIGFGKDDLSLLDHVQGVGPVAASEDDVAGRI